MGVERRIVPVKGGAVGTDDFALIAHVEKDMRVVERRCGPYAHEFLGADLDHRHARIVVKMRNDVVRHGNPRAAFADLRRTIAIQLNDA